MKKTYTDLELLRRNAERMVDDEMPNTDTDLSKTEILKLIHKLEVVQAKQQIQNKKLALAKVQSEKLAKEKYDQLYDFAPSGFFTLSKEGELHDLNLNGSKMLGKERGDLKNSLFGIYVSRETRPIFDLFLLKVFERNTAQTCEIVIVVIDQPEVHLHLTGKSENGKQCLVIGVDITELDFLRKNDSTFPVEMSTISFKDMHGQERTSLIERDITERKQVEAQVLQSEKLYSDLFNSMIEGFCIIEMIFDENMKPVNYRFLETNVAYEEQTGFTDVVGKLMRDLAPELEEFWVETYGRVALTGQLIRFENKAKAFDRWFDVCAFRIGGEGSRKVAVCFNDITQRKQAATTQFEISELNRLLFENSGDAILLAHSDGSIYSANPEACRLFGRSEDEIKKAGKSVLADINDPGIKAAIDERSRMGQFTGEVNFLRKDGTPFPVEISSIIFRDSLGIERTGSFFRDISERKQAEASLLRSEERYRMLFNSMISAFCIIEMIYDENMKPVDYRFLETNAVFEQQTGLIDAKGKLMRTMAPDHEEYWFELYGQIAMSGQLMRFENEAKALNRWYDVCAFPMVGHGSAMVAICFNDITKRKQVEVALQKSEKNLADIYASMSEGLSINEMIYDADGKAVDYVTIDINPAFEKITGQEISGCIGKKSAQRYSPGKNLFLDEYAHVASSGEPIQFEFYFAPLNKILSVSAFSPEKGKFAVLFRDITEIKQAEKALAESNEQFQLLFENSSDAIFFTKPDGSIFSLNPVAERMLGWSKEEILSLGRYDISNVNDPRLIPALEQRRKTGTFRGELTYRRKDGTIFPVDVISKLYTDSNGIERASIVARDITEGKQAEAVLRRSEERYRTLFNSMIEGFCVIEMIFDANRKPVDYRFLETNKTYEEQSGLVGVVGKLMRDITPEIEDYWFDIYGKIALTGVMIRIENESKALNKWFDVCAFRMGGEGSLKVAVCFSDITKRKQAEELVHINNLRLHLAMQAGNMAWWEMDVPTGNVNFERQKVEMLGYAPEEFKNYKDFMALVHPDDNERCMNAMRLHFEGLADRYEVDYRILTQSGTYIWCSDIGTIIKRDANGNPLTITGVAFNIDKHKRAEEEILTNNARLSLAMKVSNMAWWEMNIITGNISFEKRKAEMLGYSAENFTHYKDFMVLVHPEDAERAMEAMRKHIYGSADKYEVEYRILAKSGEYKWFYDIGSITKRDANGKGILATGLVTNITERKKAEKLLREKEELLIKAQEIGHLGSWSLDLVTNVLTWSEEIYRIYGLQTIELSAGYEGFLDTVHPEDREAVNLAFTNSLIQGNPGFDIEHRLIRKHTGELRYVWESGENIKDASGNVIRSVGMVLDITERKLAEIALRESDEKVRFKLQSILLPEGSIADLELNDILDVRSLQNLMDNFYELIQIPIAIIDNDGKVIVGVGWQETCVKFHRVHPESCRNCIESDLHLTEGIADGEFKLYKCKNNMWDLATPLIIGGEHKGNLFLGQFLFNDEAIDYNLFRKQADQYGFAVQDYIDALEKAPRLNQQKLDHAKAFFLNLARSISQLSYGNIKLARAITQQNLVEQALKKLSEELEERVIERTDQLVRANNTLRQTEEKYRTVADFTYDWEYWINADGQFIYVSPSCKRISGYEAIEFINDSKLLSHIIFNADAKIWKNHRIDVPKFDTGEISSEFNIRIVTKTGDIRWICCIYQKIFVDGNFLGIRASNRDITDKISADNELLNVTLKIEERERNHFSRELHDGLGPILSIVKLYFQWLAKTNNSEKSNLITEEGNQYIDSAIQTTHEMAYGLSSLILVHSGFVQTVLNYTKTIRETQKLNVDFTFNTRERFDHLTETTLYRITTELINNTIKYAKASNIEIELNFQKELLLVTYRYADNGIGFDLANRDKNKNGLGLLNIQNRVEILKGKLQIETSPGKGLKICVELPVIGKENS